MKTEHITGILVSICIALASFSLKWTFDANAELKVLNQKIEQMQANRDRDDSQDRQLKLLWKYTSWLENQNYELRFKLGMPPALKPQWDN